MLLEYCAFGVMVLCPYNTSDSPITIVVLSLVIIVVPILSPYCYYCAPQKPTIFIVVPLHFYCYVGSNYIVTPQTPIYRKEVFSFVSSNFFHLCNVKEVSPSKRLILKSLIYLFFYFVSLLHNIWYQCFGFESFVAPNRSSWNF